MSLTVEELRASVIAISDDVAGAHARLDPPFEDRALAERLARVPGAQRAVADRLAAAYSAVGGEIGDGEKGAVLVACEIVRAALARWPTEGRANLPGAVDVAAGRAAEWVEQNARLVRTPAEVTRIATTAAGGDDDLGSAMCEAFRRAGRDGTISAERGSDGAPAGIELIDRADESGGAGNHVEVVVSGGTGAETAARHYRAIAALHSARLAIAGGLVPGGGVAFARAAESLRTEAGADTVTGLAALAVLDGLEAPLRVRVAHAGLDPNAIFSALANESDLTFDQNKPGLVPIAEGPIDAARVVAGAIREAGRAACDLLRLAR